MSCYIKLERDQLLFLSQDRISYFWKMSACTNCFISILFFCKCVTWWAGCGTWHCRCQCTGDRWSLCQGSCLWSTSSCPDRSSDTACNIWNNNYLHPIVRQVAIISPLDQLILNWTASGGQVLLVGKTDYNLAGAGRLVQSTLLDPGSVPFEISIFYILPQVFRKYGQGFASLLSRTDSHLLADPGVTQGITHTAVLGHCQHILTCRVNLWNIDHGIVFLLPNVSVTHNVAFGYSDVQKSCHLKI